MKYLYDLKSSKSHAHSHDQIFFLCLNLLRNVPRVRERNDKKGSPYMGGA